MPIFFYTIIAIYRDDDWHIDDAHEGYLFQICFNMVHLRLYNIKRVKASLELIFEDLMEIFYHHKYALSNICGWTISAVSLIGFLHYFACGWCWIATRKRMLGY